MTETKETLRVFISYARRDASAFAEELLCGLELAGFEAYLDRHDIEAGVDWEARLGGLIQSADTVVFVISPAAVASERCDWEVKRAEALSKRIIPVVHVDVPEEQAPLGLKRLNYIFFNKGSFTPALGELARALRVDFDWIREHTRLGELAQRWQARNQSEVLLLRGPELDAARAWLAVWKAPAPEPTDLHRAFINESEAAEGAAVKRERKRQRALRISLGAATLVFAGLAAAATVFGLRERTAREGEAFALQRADDEKQKATNERDAAVRALAERDEALHRAQLADTSAQEATIATIAAREAALHERERANEEAQNAALEREAALAAREREQEGGLRVLRELQACVAVPPLPTIRSRRQEPPGRELEISCPRARYQAFLQAGRRAMSEPPTIDSRQLASDRFINALMAANTVRFASGEPIAPDDLIAINIELGQAYLELAELLGPLGAVNSDCAAGRSETLRAALGHFEQAAALGESAGALRGMGCVRMALGQTPEAIADFERALTLAPNDTDIRRLLDRARTATQQR